MTSGQRDGRRLAVALIAIVLQLLLAVPYVGLAVLVVPGPLFFAFWAIWLVGLALVIVLALRRSKAALLVPVVWTGIYLAAIWAGTEFLGWGR